MPRLLTETARGEGRLLQDDNLDLIVVSRTVYRNGLQSVQHFYFKNIDEFFDFLKREEPNDSAFDPEDLSLVFHRRLPTSPETRIYTVHSSNLLEALKSFNQYNESNGINKSLPSVGSFDLNRRKFIEQPLNQRALFSLPGVYTWQM